MAPDPERSPDISRFPISSPFYLIALQAADWFKGRLKRQQAPTAR
jgi:hypothetical protein